MIKDYLGRLRNKLFDVNAVLLTKREAIRVINTKECQLNVYNFKKLRAQSPSKFGFIYFDPNNNCNLHCVYCHNHRSDDIIVTDDFQSFIENNVISTANFQMGCIMEPTLDPRLCNLMLMVANSPAKPNKAFLLQTNGILLHKHDYGKIRDARLTHLSVSIDAADPETQKFLRSGTSLKKVISNVVSFRKSCPEIEVIFTTTVTSKNVRKMENLVAVGLEVGVNRFYIREVFYHPDNNVVDHERTPGLLLKENDFSRMKQNLIAKFGTPAHFVFQDLKAIETSTRKLKSMSFR